MTKTIKTSQEPSLLELLEALHDALLMQQRRQQVGHVSLLPLAPEIAEYAARAQDVHALQLNHR